jgi:hypothetical protein
MLPSRFGENINPTHVQILTNQLLKLEKLQENRLIAQDLVASNYWNRSLWSCNLVCNLITQLLRGKLGVSNFMGNLITQLLE